MSLSKWLMPGPSRLGLELEMPVLLSLVMALLTLVPCSYFCYLGSCRNGMRENVVCHCWYSSTERSSIPGDVSKLVSNKTERRKFLFAVSDITVRLRPFPWTHWERGLALVIESACAKDCVWVWMGWGF